MPFGFVSLLKGEVGEVRREVSFERIWGGKVVVLGGQRVLSLSRTKAVIVIGVCVCVCNCSGCFFSVGCCCGGGGAIVCWR